MHINLNHLEAFCVLSETLSFSQTAKILGTAQPAISRKIKSLELNLGTELFLRSQKQVKLTEKGMELKDKILPSYRHLISHIRVDDQKQSVVKIGCIYEAGLKLLIPVLDSWQRSFGLNADVRMQSANHLLDELMRGELDIILTHKLPEQRSLIAYDIFDDSPVLIGSKTTSKDWQNQDEELSFVTYRSDDAYTDDFLKKHFSKKILKKTKRTSSVNSHQAMVEMVASGSCYAVIPQSSLGARDESQVKVLLRDNTTYPIVLCTRENFLTYSQQKKYFMDLVQRMKKGKV